MPHRHRTADPYFLIERNDMGPPAWAAPTDGESGGWGWTTIAAHASRYTARAMAENIAEYLRTKYSLVLTVTEHRDV